MVQDEQDWSTLQDQLRTLIMRPRSKLNTICIAFDLDTMSGFKNHKRVSLYYFLRHSHHTLLGTVSLLPWS
jgi:hypothetical protein